MMPGDMRLLGAVRCSVCNCVYGNVEVGSEVFAQDAIIWLAHFAFLVCRGNIVMRRLGIETVDSPQT